MKVTILLGSVREGRESHRPARYVAAKLKEKGIETNLIDLAEERLPILGYETGSSEETIQIKKIGEQMDESDGLIFVTPEYQASFSGAIKNAIDHYYPEFHKKAIGVVATSAGGMAGINASSQLQDVILGVGAFPMPMKLLVPHVHKAFDDSFKPQNGKVVKMTEQFLDEFLWFSDALVQKKKAENEKEQAA
ncbi:MAG: NAD(P)H-dependent oxidoreductase [Balneolaceae bacterium]|nr:NAD(P)H-dependent oxidoreductase [Balneolaceae bacterium]